jgi:hypothetical protein
MKKFILPFLLSAFTNSALQAQDTLPKFSVDNMNNKTVIVRWVNNHPLVKQINVQRSFDSTRGYTTILNVADPMSKQNGYADVTAPNKNMFYRLFVVLDKGEFYFTAAKKPVLDTSLKRDLTKINKLGNAEPVSQPTNYNLSGKNKPDIFIPSSHVFAQKDGFIRVNLPDAQTKKYSIKFYDADESLLFELKDIRQPVFMLDKTNFYHAGWFRFELFENNILIEKHKFFLAKDF